jgi:hypothetical protein
VSETYPKSLQSDEAKRVNSDLSAQTRNNRVAGGRKAAAVKAARAAQVAAARRDNPFGPDGPVRGSAPVDFSIGELLARIRAASPPGGS